MKFKYKKLLKRIAVFCLILFVLMNVIAAFQAYRFTHFVRPGSAVKLTKNASTAQKIKALFLGVQIPKPVNTQLPSQPFETIYLKGKKDIECWYIKTASLQPKGTVILFHGYVGCKAGLLDKAAIFRDLGYNTLLVDFMGSGGSEGYQTTIGYYEAEEVSQAFDYIQSKGEQHIILFGTSMGAVAIMKAIHDNAIRPRCIIIECPFGTMLQTVQARFKAFNVPAFPMADLLVFWGGVANGFNGFRHNPENYAAAIKVPALLLYGAKDVNVSRAETDAIYHNLEGKKSLVIFPNAAHENYLNRYKTEWTAAIRSWLLQVEKQ